MSIFKSKNIKVEVEEEIQSLEENKYSGLNESQIKHLKCMEEAER